MLTLLGACATDAPTARRAVPGAPQRLLTAAPRYKQVTAGNSHSCAVTASNTLACWGSNSDGDGQATPPAGTGYTQVSGRWFHACAVNANGALACWGNGTATSGPAVALTSLTPATCPVADGIVTFAAAGACTLAADQPGATRYTAAPRVTQSITVVRRPPAITFSPAPPASARIGTGLTLSATGGASGSPVVLSSSGMARHLPPAHGHAHRRHRTYRARPVQVARACGHSPRTA